MKSHELQNELSCPWENVVRENLLNTQFLQASKRQEGWTEEKIQGACPLPSVVTSCLVTAHILKPASLGTAGQDCLQHLRVGVVGCESGLCTLTSMRTQLLNVLKLSDQKYESQKSYKFEHVLLGSLGLETFYYWSLQTATTCYKICNLKHFQLLASQ